MEVILEDVNQTGIQRNCSHGENRVCIVKFYTECVVMGLIGINMIGMYIYINIIFFGNNLFFLHYIFRSTFTTGVKVLFET